MFCSTSNRSRTSDYNILTSESSRLNALLIAHFPLRQIIAFLWLFWPLYLQHIKYTEGEKDEIIIKFDEIFLCKI